MPAPSLDALRDRIARIERGTTRRAAVLRFGVPAIDGHLPRGGLSHAALHEVAGAGLEAEHGAAASLLVAGLLAAGLLAQGRGTVFWVLERRDVFAPGLAAAGLHPDRVVFVEAGRNVLLVMEEALRHGGLVAVVGEVGRLGLTASRRLQLAAESSGVIAFALRHSRMADDPVLTEPNAAVTRWRVATLPSPPPMRHAPHVAGLAPVRWRLDLTRCRGGVPATWMVEACDAQGRLALVANAGDGQAAPERRAG